MTPSFFKELISYGGEAQAFFPSILRLINFRINNRNHRKLCIIDGEVAYVGGFNVGDEYLGLDPKMGYWRDTHFRIKGESVNDIQGRFILDWHQATKQPIELEQFLHRTETHSGTVPVQIVASGPNSDYSASEKHVYLIDYVGQRKCVPSDALLYSRRKLYGCL